MKKDMYSNVKLFQNWNNLTIDDRILKIKETQHGISKKAIDILSKMDEGVQYSYNQLNCHNKTLFSLLCRNCLNDIRFSLAPSKNDKFEISKSFFYDLQFNEDLKNGTYKPNQIIINIESLSNL